MNISLWSKPEPMPTTLADEAFAVVGNFDALRAKNIAALRDYRKSLHAHVKHGLDALTAVDAVLAREDGNRAQAAIEEALDGIELDLAPVSPSSSKRKKGREAVPA
jgi:hypothetical protein